MCAPRAGWGKGAGAAPIGGLTRGWLSASDRHSLAAPPLPATIHIGPCGRSSLPLEHTGQKRRNSAQTDHGPPDRRRAPGDLHGDLRHHCCRDDARLWQRGQMAPGGPDEHLEGDVRGRGLLQRLQRSRLPHKTWQHGRGQQLRNQHHGRHGARLLHWRRVLRDVHTRVLHIVPGPHRRVVGRGHRAARGGHFSLRRQSRELESPS